MTSGTPTAAPDYAVPGAPSGRDASAGIMFLVDHPSRYPIWSLLRQARKEAGLSQRQLAELAGTSQAAVARYEKARVMPDLATLFRLLRCCGFDLRLDLQPHDDHDEVLIAENLRRSPAERAARNRSATRMRAAAARSRVSGAAVPDA